MKECVAMILAGGQGTRLGALTKSVAKPAVSFGGKYRIIDFPLSNCSHSGIDTVGVLTQYEPLVLNTYIGNGNAWDLDRNDGGVYVLPPYQSADSGKWYKGTADAIYQNMMFMEKFQPENVLILSGDHIYKMHYGEMLEAHKKSDADITIAVMPVAWEEASRFGIMNVDENNNIVEFEEKPKNPKSNLASMGIYIFKYDILKKYLTEDENNPESANDFGKNIIPAMLKNKEKLVAWRFEGYWKDVGTISSLWEANMDLIGDKPKLDLMDSKWRIFSKTQALEPHYIGKNAKIYNSAISEGCYINANIKNSVIGTAVTVDEGSIVNEAVIMSGAKIGKNVIIEKAIIGENSIIEDDARIGADSVDNNIYASSMCTEGIVLIDGNVKIEKGHIIPKGSMVENKN